MSSVDFEQTAEDHCRLLILVKQVGCHLKPKSLNFVYDCISKVTSHQVASPPRTIYLKYLKQYQRENSEWGDFQAHRKVLGLVCIGKCDDVNEVGELYKLHEDLKEQYSGTLYDSRLILLGLKQDGSAIEKRLRRDGTSHVICYPGEENCAGDLEIRMQEFVLSLFWVLESKRMDRRSLERHDRMALLTAPFEKKDMVGVDTDTRMYRKRCQGRLRKFLGDLCLLAGVPSEAMAHYQTASDILRSSADWLWLGAAYEGICAATVIMAKPPSRNAPKVGFQRNLSFSMQRGVSVQKEHLSQLPFTATLGRNFSNGFDLSEVRNSATPLPDDIIEKYRETVQQYAKFRNAGVVELEASLKACRVLVTQNKYLAAADFLQNVVYINIIMITEEEKTNRFSVLAELYDQLGMHRKAGFFRRISAMQSVSPANPKPGWPYCYRTLLQALSSFHLSLDPKDHKPGMASGWPVAQLRVLHDLIVSARKMGNPAIAIRHLTYLLHTMIEHLSVDEIKEMASILESYTSRCEGTPQALALDDGTILPPVPLLKFPTVKSLKLLNLPPHLRPVKLSKNSSDPVEKVKSANNPFIYSPLQIFKASSKTAEEKCELDFCWVQGDVCETSVFVSNPLPFELHCSNLGLLTEGIKFESYPSSLSLPAESGPFHVKLTGVPKESGSLVVHGYTTNSLGVRSHCRLRDMPQIEQNHYKIKVVPPLPQLQVSTSLPKSEMFSTLDDSDSVVTSASASLFAGERYKRVFTHKLC
ncbi:hypothetical protein CAPTEDRAFT_114828 [Capitella teleta]|uniref:Trafficking protein particle complex subunit 9 n=1 Tax=Capitella teleta TaxID=283909 RepID=R7VBV9_CAPTE|nr:hypothetical protein CAPTEDRAFT_114828 [Capitella teleta]|eukprot:ELU16047.1 hypothetical protein CAPTEDRAFT_114828 [Capitella teleta]